MANYYIHFSIKLSVTPEQTTWWHSLEAALEQSAADRTGTPFDVLNSILEDIDLGCLDLCVKHAAGAVYLHDDFGNPDLEAVASILQEFLRAHESKELITFSWADICDKPRADAYGGGIFAITATRIASVNTATLESQAHLQHAAGVVDLDFTPETP